MADLDKLEAAGDPKAGFEVFAAKTEAFLEKYG